MFMTPFVIRIGVVNTNVIQCNIIALSGSYPPIASQSRNASITQHTLADCTSDSTASQGDTVMYHSNSV